MSVAAPAGYSPLKSVTVPVEWTTFVGLHHYARIDRAAMRSAPTQQARDEATVRYTRAVDEMMDQLAKLDDDRQLVRITTLLSRKELR